MLLRLKIKTRIVLLTENACHHYWQHCYCYSYTDLEVFHPTWHVALMGVKFGMEEWTTPPCEIWHGGVVHSSMPNFTPMVER